MLDWPAELPTHLEIRVSSWNGDVSINQDPGLRARFGRDLRPWHCVGHVLRYERVRPIPTYDHEFTLAIDASGAMRVVRP
jgi:hypothetical protein